MVIVSVEEDPVRKFSEPEKVSLAQNLLYITEQIRTVDSKNILYSNELLRKWHKKLFEGVRDHAGRFRSSDYGEEHLNFGPNRSIVAAAVDKKLTDYQRSVNVLIDKLTDLEQSLPSPEFVNEVIKVALYLHAELIHIHPFRDGNGRIGRLIITYILCHFNLPPIIFETPKEEYLECLNYYYKTKDLNPLVNLALRNYKNQLLSN